MIAALLISTLGFLALTRSWRSVGFALIGLSMIPTVHSAGAAIGITLWTMTLSLAAFVGVAVRSIERARR